MQQCGQHVTLIGCEMKMDSTTDTQNEKSHSLDFSGPKPPATVTVSQKETATTQKAMQ